MLPIGAHLVWNFAVLIPLYSGNPSFAPPTTQDVLEKGEAAPSNFNVKLKEAYETLSGFFRPVTCRYKDEQALIPCHVGEGLNATECLENECCPSKTGHEPKCYMPLKDDVQLTFRVLALVAGGFLILACLPFCCSPCMQRSPCFDPLRKASKEIQRIVWKRRARSEDVYSPLLN